jgi:hypothetical protein
MNLVKFIGAWGCLMAAFICLLVPGAQAWMYPMFAASACFSLAPTAL